jgi:hypothetical protein
MSMELTSNSMEPNSEVVLEKSKHRGNKKHGRARLTNARELLLDQVDGRSALYRRYRDVANAILADQGGIEQCSESRKYLIKRFAAAAVLSEQIETKIVNGEEVDVAEFAQLSSTLVRITNHLGLERVPRVINGSSYVGDVIDGELVTPEPESATSLRNRMSTAEDVDAA